MPHCYKLFQNSWTEQVQHDLQSGLLQSFCSALLGLKSTICCFCFVTTSPRPKEAFLYMWKKWWKLQLASIKKIQPTNRFNEIQSLSVLCCQRWFTIFITVHHKSKFPLKKSCFLNFVDLSIGCFLLLIETNIQLFR